jgi:hypothetical protein
MSMSNVPSGDSRSGPRASLAPITIALVSMLLACAFASRATAQATDREAEARAHFRLSQSHYELGHFAEAAAELERAYALSPRPDLLYNLYVARRDAGQLAAAASALRDYLAQAEQIENAALLRHRLAALEAQLAAGEASASADSSGTDDETTSGPRADAGLAEQASTGPSASETAPAETAPSAESVRPSQSARSPSPVGYAVLGVGAAALVAGLVTGGLALDRYGALEATCGADHGCPPGTEGARDEGLALATSTDALLIGGGVIATVGVVLLFTVLDETPAPPVSASCDGDGCRAAASFSF